MPQVFKENDVVEMISGELRGIVLRKSQVFENAVIVRVTWVDKNSEYNGYGSASITIPKQHLRKI